MKGEPQDENELRALGFVPDGHGGWRKLRRGESAQPVSSAPGQCTEEDELHNDILAYCRERGWLPFHGSMAHRARRTIGEPDFHILLPGGRHLLVECKTKTGKLTPEQLAVKIHAESLDHTVHIVRSMDEFKSLL